MAAPVLILVVPSPLQNRDMLSCGAVTRKPPNKQRAVSHIWSDVSQSISFHPDHLEYLACRVTVKKEEKARGIDGVFLRARLISLLLTSPKPESSTRRLETGICLFG